MSKTLNLTEYTPNFNDPRVRKKAIAVLDWCDSLRLFKKGKIVHHDTLTEVFGNRSQRGLAKWLYSNLLTQTGHYMPGTTSYSYYLNERGYKKVHRLLGSEPKAENEIIKEVYAPIISGVEKPEYKDSGTRRYHPIQNVKRDIRAEIFAGWWDYDIENCAPTLIHQFVTTAWWDVPISKNEYPALIRLIEDKQAVREEIAKLTELDIQSVKKLLTAVFFRGNPAPSNKAGIFRILGLDIVKHQTFLNHPYIKQLRDDVLRLWSKAILYDELITKNLKNLEEAPSLAPKKRLTRRRMSIYLSLERQVIHAIEEVLNEKAVPFINVHDGFMTKTRVQKRLLIDRVKEKTGFSIKLSEKCLSPMTVTESDPDVLETMKGDIGDEDVLLVQKIKEINKTQ